MFIPDKCVVSRHIVEASVGKRQCPSPSLLVKVTPVYLLVNKCECVTYLIIYYSTPNTGILQYCQWRQVVPRHSINSEVMKWIVLF